MRGIAQQAAVLSLSRIANYGLMVISPIILVRILSVDDFGRYREFLLYSSLLQSLASFSFSASLLYFIPLHPSSPWRVVRETASLTGLFSLSVVGVFVACDLLAPRGLVGPYLVPMAIYVLLYVNLDWWESFWVAVGRPLLVFWYTGGRLIARLLVVICAALLSRDVWVIIWALIALETLRLLGSFAVWRRADRSAGEPPVGDIRRQQLAFCVPLGLAAVVFLVGRNLGNVVVAKYLGAAALAQLTIGTYGEPIILALRDSISQVVLTELVRLRERSRDDALALWYRTTVINCVLLFPVAAVIAWYAEPLLLKTFGAAYRPAIPVLQWYALVIVRSCFDFAPLLRAINKTRPFITSCAVLAVANALTLVVLLPAYGIVAAAAGLVVSNVAEAVYLALCVRRLYGIEARRLLPWAAVAKVILCSGGAGVIAFGITYQLRASLLGAVLGSVFYCAVYAALLKAIRLEEANILLRRVQALVPSIRGHQAS
jgi:O-antigen/teichoic acid export membrane protein